MPGPYGSAMFFFVQHYIRAKSNKIPAITTQLHPARRSIPGRG